MESSITPHSQLQLEPSQSKPLIKKVPSNSTQSATNPAQRKALAKFREGLPICRYKEDIINHIKKHPITVISGDTGSGKSTQLPQYLYESWLSGHKLIGITQPRRVAALTLAQRVALEV